MQTDAKKKHVRCPPCLVNRTIRGMLKAHQTIILCGKIWKRQKLWENCGKIADVVGKALQISNPSPRGVGGAARQTNDEFKNSRQMHMPRPVGPRGAGMQKRAVQMSMGLALGDTA